MTTNADPHTRPHAPGTGLEARMVVRRPDDQTGDFVLDVDLSVPAGTTAALLGPNGAGKSTVVATLAGLEAVREGRIRLGRHVLDDPVEDVLVAPPDRSVGVVFQDHLLFPHLDVRDNVAFGLRSRGVPRAPARRRAEAWLERLGLARLATRRPGALSGGQAQRVALARALVIDPDLLLLDEPLSALDVTTRAELRHTLASHLEAFAGPRLLITHDPTEAFLLADHVHVLEDGRITQHGSPDDLRLRPRTPYAADLAGTNLLEGVARDGIVDLGARSLHIGDHQVAGPVLVSLRPTAISVYLAHPGGSPRNTWRTRVARVESLGDRVRLRSAEPVALTIEVTREAATELGLAEGTAIWIAVKATELGVDVVAG